MNKFLRYIFFLLTSLVVMMCILDYTYTYIYKNGTPRNKISYLLNQKEKQIDYVFIGSSRVDNHIDADVIESITGKKALNLGIQGGKVDDFLVLLQLLELQNIKTEYVFIQMDYVYNLGGNSEFLMSRMIPFTGDDKIRKIIRERDPDYFYINNIPFYRYLKYDFILGFREIVSLLGKNPVDISLENGYFPKYGNSGEKLELYLPDKIIRENEKVNSINDFALDHNIKVVYFMAPVCSGTINLEYTNKLKEKLPNFLDYSRKFMGQDRYFFNCAHLNDRGAKEFSKIIANDIQQSDFKLKE